MRITNNIFQSSIADMDLLNSGTQRTFYNITINPFIYINSLFPFTNESASLCLEI
jgi:hypothetical protein